jgi:CRP/FNR family transcriptional regulator, dissimilatory nitrate respiration regulator
LILIKAAAIGSVAFGATNSSGGSNMATAGQPCTNGFVVAQAVARLPLFQELTAEQLSGIVAAARHVQLTRGELLFQKGDQARGFYVITAGQIKLAFPSASGAEKVVEILGPGQSFGEALMFLDRPYPVFAAAVLDATVIEIPQHPVTELLMRDPSFARSMLAGLAKRLHSLVQDVEDYTMRSGTQRLIGYLLQKAGDVESGPIEVVLSTSKAVIASRLNLTPETLSRSLHELMDKGLLDVHGKHVTVYDIQRLRIFDS